jgi:hypothetical protein
MSPVIAKLDQQGPDRSEASLDHARRYRADRFGISAEELEAIVQRARPTDGASEDELSRRDE